MASRTAVRIFSFHKNKMCLQQALQCYKGVCVCNKERVSYIDSRSYNILQQISKKPETVLPSYWENPAFQDSLRVISPTSNPRPLRMGECRRER